MLLQHDPASPRLRRSPLTALAVAKRQGTRSFGLRAAPSLAKLYQSTGRPADAHAALAPALEGFAPTSQMPEIAEAQALLATLAGTDEVKADGAQRRRRLGLQTSYARAVMYSKGYAADETKAAFERADDVAVRADLTGERFPALYGQIMLRLFRGDALTARDLAERFLREAEAEGRISEICVGHRLLGMACLWLGDLAGAQTQFDQALTKYDGERDSAVRHKFGQDSGVAIRSYLPLRLGSLATFTARAN